MDSSPEAADQAVIEADRALRRWRQGDGPEPTEAQRQLLERPGLDACALVDAAHRRQGTYRGLHSNRRQWG